MVLCQPLAQEYLLSHRSMRRLGELLAGAGFAALRFDYFGCGDSPGDLTEARLDRWLLDVEAATEQLAESSGCARICIVGLRLGANLALHRGLTDPRIDSMVLWDPVGDMVGYLEADSGTATVARPDSEFALEGFEVTGALVEDLRRMDLSGRAGSVQARVLLIQTEAESSGPTFVSSLEAAGATVEHRPQAGPSIWKEDINRVVVPHKLLQSMVAWIGQQPA